MNVSEYIPLYSLLFNYEYQTRIDGKRMTANKMFEDYPEQELSDYQIEQLDFFDLASLQKALSDEYFTPDNVIPYLRGLFDNYRENGGNPFDWLEFTFQSVNLNPQNYRKDLITYIEKALIEWIEIFEKQPIDYLFLNSNPEPKFTNTPQQQKIKNQRQKEINDFSFFQIVIVGSIEVDGKIYENVKQRNNESIITTDNWNKSKLEFFNQRMNTYKDSFSQTEKIELEIENLNKEEFETDNHKILKKRYLDLLNRKLNSEPQTQEKEIEHCFSSKTNFELFKYLDDWFKPSGKKAKYTYIFNHFKDNNFEPLLSQNNYLEFVMSFKNIKIADRLQGAPSNKIDAEINRLVVEFKKLNS
jgi:hypothetical protein